ncbi:pyridoxamine 5'-phosphate oxidase family protein [Agromyces endophyticus]|uniref:pyridoxamine 5'-phosphate oxidase family protein n=1 Tax=Agromyces sp. H17E-10 TaxID=2932244 RepID=UPI001FD2D85E|nr:pyridoxamine 5'-phosphate oxidase family protein [Agromyces sp. H17E-10]UOQ90903.1 pyridoxamine 5'-phosphate oxidase family protein [Agromyces sp. H17E-10]
MISTSTPDPAPSAAAEERAPRGIRRKPDRQRTDRASIDALLDGELVGHLAVVVDGAPIVVPTGYARIGDHLVMHGSTGAGFVLRAVADRATVAFSVTAIDGLVFGRSIFASSMNYRSLVAYGVLEAMSGEDEREALVAMTDRLMPGRSGEVRDATRKEYAQTRALRLALDDVVMKVRDGGASEDLDDGEDHDRWAGVLPVATTFGVPQPSGLTPPGTPLPGSVRTLMTRSAVSRKLS